VFDTYKLVIFNVLFNIDKPDIFKLLHINLLKVLLSKNVQFEAILVFPLIFEIKVLVEIFKLELTVKFPLIIAVPETSKLVFTFILFLIIELEPVKLLLTLIILDIKFVENISDEHVHVFNIELLDIYKSDAKLTDPNIIVPFETAYNPPNPIIVLYFCCKIRSTNLLF
jgi:hypothetical protein